MRRCINGHIAVAIEYKWGENWQSEIKVFRLTLDIERVIQNTLMKHIMTHERILKVQEITKLELKRGHTEHLLGGAYLLQKHSFDINKSFELKFWQILVLKCAER